MSKIPEVGQAAPAFTLPGLRLEAGRAQRREYSVSEQRGRALVLAFYPGDETRVCTRQMCSYSAEMEQFTDVGAEVWGISPQDLESHERFARKHDLAMPLLADTDLSTADAYGITLGSGLRRSVFLLDGDGIVRWRHVALVGVTYRSVDTLVEQLHHMS